MSTLHTLVLALLLHSNTQKKAQEEIDKLIGQQRLPQLSDWEALLYVEALMYESIRWVSFFSHHWQYTEFPFDIDGTLPLHLVWISFISQASPSVHNFIGIPHRVMEDNIYQGMFIPKGSTVISNVQSVAQSDVLVCQSNVLSFRTEAWHLMRRCIKIPTSSSLNRICHGQLVLENHILNASLGLGDGEHLIDLCHT